MDLATSLAIKSNIVELGAQVCLAGICAAVLIYFSAKLASALAGAAATASMQGLASVGIGAAVFGAAKLATPKPSKPKGGGDNGNNRTPLIPEGGGGGGTKPNMQEMRRNAIKQAEESTARRLREAQNPADKPVTWTTQPPVNPNPKQPKP